MFVPKLKIVAKGTLMQYPYLSLVYLSLVKVQDYTRNRIIQETEDCYEMGSSDSEVSSGIQLNWSMGRILGGKEGE